MAKFKSKNGISFLKLKCLETLNVFMSILGICTSKDIYFSNKYNVNQKLQDDSLEQTVLPPHWFWLYWEGIVGGHVGRPN